jgi:hypothetical protein
MSMKNKEHCKEDVEFVIVINNQINATRVEQASATQVASGGGDENGDQTEE